MFNKKIFLIISLLFLCIFLCADFILADRNLEIDYPSVIGTETIDETTNLPGFIKYIFNFIITIGGILAFGILIYSAIRLFLSAGNPQEISEAKSQIMSAVMGLAILFGSYTILTIINPDLRILHISELNPFEETESDPYKYEDLETEIYKEIPVGFLAENILAKNINCFDYDIDGIDGNPPTGDRIDGDGDGKNDLLQDHDRLDCLKKLAQAIQIKSETLKNKSNQLKIETKKCNCRYCDRGWCTCDDNCCHCCGSARNKLLESCFGHCWRIGNDPCPTRNDYAYFGDALEITCDYYYIDDKIMCKGIDTLRNDIYQIAYGDARQIDLSRKLSFRGGIFLEDNPNPNPTFFCLKRAREDMISFKNELQKDLDHLKGAEKLADNSIYGQRISLAEYQEKKLNEKIDKKEYKNFNISEYCKNFHCAPIIKLSLDGISSGGAEFDCVYNEVSKTYTCSTDYLTLEHCVEKDGKIVCPTFVDGVCYVYELNASGKLCETYNFDGDGATLYFPEDKYEK